MSWYTVPGRDEVKQVPNNEGRYTGQHEGNVPDHGMEGQMRDLHNEISI